jgi:hypothetical protein
MLVCAQVVVQEMRTVVADPKLQAQIVDYAKQACSVFPSYQATCEADVEQYAPMAFGMALAYLQPEQVRTYSSFGHNMLLFVKSSFTSTLTPWLLCVTWSDQWQQ